MAFLDHTITLDELPVSNNDFQPLPSGWYSATITKAEVKATKAGTGEYINLKYDITGPTHQGRVVFGIMNIKNPSEVAEGIGRKQLGQLMRAIGLTQVSDTDQLIGANVSIKLEIKEAKGGYEASNDVQGWKSVEGGSMPAPQASGKAAPPWAKK